MSENARILAEIDSEDKLLAIFWVLPQLPVNKIILMYVILNE